MSVLFEKISIDGRQFSDYHDLAEHIAFLVEEYDKGTSMVKRDRLIDGLYEIKDILVFGKNENVYQYLLRDCFHESYVSLIESCRGKDDVKLLCALLSCVITITDNSKRMCELLVRHGYSSALITQTIRICSKTFKFPWFYSVEFVMNKLILAVINIATCSRFQQSFLQDAGLPKFKKAIIVFLESSDLRLRLMTMGVMTWLHEEDDNRYIKEYITTIENYHTCIQKGLIDQRRRYEGIRVSQLLKVVENISNIESMRHTIIQMKPVITMIENILQAESSNTEEIQLTLGIIYNLSFGTVIENIRIDDFCKVEDLVKPFTSNPNLSLKRFAEGILLELQRKNQIEEDNQKGYDIFLSFCPGDRKIISDISKSLKKANVKMWMDEGDRKDRSLADVEEALQKSKIVIIGVSNSYFNDQCCQYECRTAFRMGLEMIPVLVQSRYKAKNWLGRMITSTTLVDVSDESNLGKLLEVVRDKLGHGNIGTCNFI